MLALTLAERTYHFDPKKIQKAERLSAVETLLIFEDQGRIQLEMPRDILFIILNGRREIPNSRSFRGFRCHAWRKDGNIWRILIHPLEDPSLVIEAHFRSRDCAIWLPPPNAHLEPRRILS